MITSDGGFFLGAVSGFRWRSWANPGGTRPLPPEHCAKANSIFSRGVRLPSTNPFPYVQHSPSLL